MPTWQLVSPDDLSAFLQRPVPDERAIPALRVAAGWLLAATGLTDWPSPVPDDLWAWELELAGFALENPTSLSSRNDGEVGRSWEPRRAEILAAARDRYAVPADGGGGFALGSPRWSFPDPWWGVGA